MAIRAGARHRDRSPGADTPYGLSSAARATSPLPALPKRAALVGVVTDQHRSRLHGAAVVVTIIRSSANPPTIASTVTDATGTYRIDDLPPGPAFVAASARGHRAVTGKPVLLSANQTTELRVELDSDPTVVAVHGAVMERGGAAIPDAIVRLVGHFTDAIESAQAMKSDATGRFVAYVTPGAYDVLVARDGYADLAEARELREASILKLELQPQAIVAGIVLSDAGDGAPDCEVTLHGAAVARGPDLRVRTDADGRFEFRRLAAGRYDALAADEAGRAGRATFTVALAHQDLTIQLRPAARIAGTVTMTTAERERLPAAGAHVLAVVSGQRRPWRDVAADASGRYELTGVPPGDYDIVARHDSAAEAWRHITIATRSIPRFDFSLGPLATISGRVVLLPDSRPAPDSRIGITLVDAAGASYRRNATTLADGHFEIGRLPSGQVRVEATNDASGRTVIGPITLAAGERKFMQIALRPACSVSGTVRFDDGSPAIGAHVLAMIGGAFDAPREVKSGPDGRFVVSQTPCSRIMLAAGQNAITSLPSAETSLSSLSTMVVHATTDHPPDVTLTIKRKNASLRGVVSDSHGAPIAGATVGAVAAADLPSTTLPPWQFAAADNTAVSASDGSFVVDGLPDLPLTVWARSPAGSHVIQNVARPGGAAIRLVVPDAASVSGVVVGPSGQPAAATVSLVPIAGAGTGAELGAELGARIANPAGIGIQSTNDATTGAFELADFAPGTYRVAAAGSDGADAVSDPLIIAAGERKQGLVVRLKPVPKLKGSIVDFDSGKQLSGVTILVLGAAKVAQAASGPDGAFELTVPSGASSVTIASSLGDYAPDTRAVKHGEVNSIDLGVVRLVRRRHGPRIAPDIQLNRADDGTTIVATAPVGASIARGDTVTQIDGKSVDGVGEFGLAELTYLDPGKNHVLTVNRGGTVASVTLERARTH